MQFIFVCSPFRDNLVSVAKTRKYCRKLLLAGNVPLAPHLYFPDILESKEEDKWARNIGLEAGMYLMRFCQSIHVINDWGITDGMFFEIRHAKKLSLPFTWVKVEE